MGVRVKWGLLPGGLGFREGGDCGWRHADTVRCGPWWGKDRGVEWSNVTWFLTALGAVVVLLTRVRLGASVVDGTARGAVCSDFPLSCCGSTPRSV